VGAVRASSARLKSPFVVCLWLVDQCNLACRYCYAMPFRGAAMPRDRMLSLLDELVDQEVFDVTLAGGEPFLHPHVLDAIDCLLCGRVNVGVLSNGTLLGPELAARLVDRVAGREGFLLQISLDGLTPAVHDRTRGCGELVLRNLQGLCEQTDLRLQIATVLNAHNIGTAHELIDRYYPRVKRYHFMNLQRTEASLHHDDLFVSEERNRRFWEELEGHMRTLPADILVTGLAIMRLAHRMQADPQRHRLNSTFYCEGCTAGVTHVEITATFDVLGCDIAKDFTHMGNVAGCRFEEVWHSPKAEEVRRQPVPACYLVRDPEGHTLAETSGRA